MILITGGAGYIGSHTCIELINAGAELVVVDNLSNGKLEALNRVEKITGKKVVFYEVDVRDKVAMRAIFENHTIDAVIHFAGLKAVGESVEQPLRYYNNNTAGTLALCEVMAEKSVHNLIFSSSATVYGQPKVMPIKEDFTVGGTTNPYGSSKLMIEMILRDLQKADTRWSIAILRYFNPVGAHESGLIGEDPSGLPNNLMPYIAQVAVGKQACLNVFGGDYETSDGHLSALNYVMGSKGVLTVNLGTGVGYSVLELVQAFEAASNKKIAYKIVGRRLGDVACCYADTTFAKDILKWSATLGIEKMCEDAWRWQSNNPNGYD
jgi:UDP-glucose 4-epimerase